MTTSTALLRLAAFVAHAAPPREPRTRAADAILDTIGVTLAGAAEPASRAVQRVIASNTQGNCHVFGTPLSASAADAALANGTAAHALDFDDMCFVSLAHPSAPLVPALLATAETIGASGRRVTDAYVVGFEIETRIGPILNPRHYQRGWHCSSTIGTIGTAAAVSHLLGLDASTAAHAIAIAASEASGLKENFGTMVKPLHAGLAARNGVLAAQLAAAGLTASAHALDGEQGFLIAFQSEHDSVGQAFDDLGRRWEIVDSGITIKLYPSCAGTHPALDAVLDLRKAHTLNADAIARVDVGVDAITPTVLIYDKPSTGLEGKFSMPFCVAAALVDGSVGIDTFDDSRLNGPFIRELMTQVTMHVDDTLDRSKPSLTQARVAITLRDGRVLRRDADGARGYPDHPASPAEIDQKFLSCASQAIGPDAAAHALEQLRGIETIENIRSLTASLATAG